MRYDFLTRFSREVEGMEWGRAAGLMGILRSDPSSAIAATLEGWDHPISREALVLMDLFDLDHMVAVGGKKVEPHSGRPWKQENAKRRGRVRGMTPEQTRETLRRAARGEL